MARLPENSVPSYRLHKSSGRAVVTIDGRDIYLGTHGTPESREEYDRVLRLWLNNGRRLPDSLIGGKRRDASGRGFERNEAIILATLRADSMLVREKAFVVLTGISN